MSLRSICRMSRTNSPLLRDNKQEQIRRRKRIVAITLLLIIAINALAAGYSFIVEPSGEGLGMNTGYLEHAPFRDFFIPGLVLFVVNGILSLIVAGLSIGRKRHHEDLIYTQGVLLSGWIIVQIIMLRDFNWMHAVCLLIGFVLMRFGRELKVWAPDGD